MVEDHHVAWKDRLGLNRIWEQCILRCCTTYDTDGFAASVDLFRNTIINISGGPQLKDIIDGYVNGELHDWKDERYDEWVKLNRGDSRIPELSNKTKEEIDLLAHEFLFNFILQILEDNGFGFYKSKLEEDEII